MAVIVLVNNGKKGWKKVEEYYVYDPTITTGVVAKNLPGTIDPIDGSAIPYFAPVDDLTACPLPISVVPPPGTVVPKVNNIDFTWVRIYCGEPLKTSSSYKLK